MSKREIKTKFYTFNQNNSGGYFVEDDNAGVCEYVIVEAISAIDAYNRLCKIGESVNGFHSFCSCCGERWSDYINDSDGKDRPEIYGEPVESYEKNWYRSRAFVHYIDGTKKEFIFNEPMTI